MPTIVNRKATRRCATPLSGLVGKKDKAATDAHNAQFLDYDKNVQLLNMTNAEIIKEPTGTVTAAVQTAEKPYYVEIL